MHDCSIQCHWQDIFASLEGTLNRMPCLRKRDDQNIVCMKDYICGLGSVALSPLMHTDAH